MKIFSYVSDFINLIYPEICITCGTSLPGNEPFICPKCWLDMPKTGFHKEKDNPVEQIFWGRIPIQNGTSLFYYAKGSKYQKLIHEMKYNRKKEIGYELGKKLGFEIKDTEFAKVDYIVPVPLHRKKQRKRGFNQSEWIVKGVAEALKKPENSCNLYRKEHTKSQTKKSRYERWKNVENVFSLKNKNLFNNAHILIVDDILTTGATLEACANAILEAGNTKISIATLGIAEN